MRYLLPSEPAEHTIGQGPDPSLGTPIVQNPKHVHSLTRWSDELLGNGWGLGMGSQVSSEDTQCRGQDANLVIHNNLWYGTGVQPTCDTSSSVYDGGGQRVLEPQTDVDMEAAKKYG